MAAEGLSVKIACRVLDVTRAGFYAWKRRPLSPRVIRNVWLTDVINEIHVASRGTYGLFGFMPSCAWAAASLLATTRLESSCETLGSWVCRCGVVTRNAPDSTPLLLTWSTASSPALSPTSCGSPTSQNTAPEKASSTAASYWTRSHAARLLASTRPSVEGSERRVGSRGGRDRRSD